MPTGSERGALAKRLQKNRNRKPKSPLKLETLKSSEPKNGDSDPVITDFKYSSNCLLQILDYDGMAYTFITPNSTADALNFLALSIKTKDLISVRIVIVCVEASEAKDVHQEMAKRGVSAILYTDTESKMWTSVWQMWMQGHLNSVLIVCDDLILKLGSQKANYIIHFTLPAFSHVFFQRFALTKESSSKIETFVIRAENDTHIFPFLKPTCRQNAAALENFSTMQINENDVIEEHCNTISPVEKEPLATYVNDFQTMADSSTSSIPSMVAAGVEPMENVPLFGNEKEGALYEKSSTEQGLSKYVHVGIVAHSRLPIPVCYQSADLLVQPQIKAAMQREGICRSYRNQRVAWLHAIKGHALTVVGPKRTGKTWCYLPALCERAYQQMLQRQPMNDGVDCDVNDCGPSAIIVVASEEQGLQLAEWCRKLLDFSQLDVEILVWLFHRSNALEVCSRLVEPCGIFLTTADLFLYVLQQSKEPNPIFNPAAICCVALDGFDDMCAQWRKCCTQLLHLLPTLLKFGPNQTQLMVTTRFWLPQMLNDLLPSSPDVQLVFEDALEAAIYGGVNFEFKVAKEPELEHNRDILEFIQGLQQNPESKNLKTQGLVIACTNLEQALQLSGFLSEHNLETSIYSAHNNASNLSLAQWRLQTTPTILITIDEVLPNLRHDHISYLINFQMPSSWTTFKDRFALLYGSYKANASTLIVARKQNEFLLWHLCTFIVKHELKMPYEFIDIFFQMRVERECLAPRNDSSLCSQFIAYGNCSRRDCRHRHIIWNFECKPPKHYPIEGVIEFQIIQTYSPAQVAVRLSKHIVKNLFRSLPISDFCKSIQLYYQQDDNRKPFLDPKVGDLCIVKYNNRYERAYVTRSHGEKPIVVKFVDNGTSYQNFKMKDLYLCAEQFKDAEFEAIEVRIAGLMPYTMERIWTEEAKRDVQKNFFKRSEPQTFYATIAMVFSSTIFVDNIYNTQGGDLVSYVKKNIPSHFDSTVLKRLESVLASAFQPPSVDMSSLRNNEIKKE